MGEMTNENAIKWLKDLLKSDLPMEQYEKAIEKGIEALKPSGDLISREDTLTAFADYVGSGMSMNDYEALWDIVAKMPPVKQEPCEDAISRQAVLDGLASIAKARAKSDAQKSLMGRVMFFTEHLPPVTPQPKTGHWIYDNYNWRCSECNETPKTLGYVGTADFMTEHFKFCNHCGARMIEPQERSGEE